MKNLIILLLVLYAFLALPSCAYSKTPSESEAIQEQTVTEPPMSTEPPITTVPPPETIDFFGETYSIDEADDRMYDEDGNITFVLFHNIGFIGLADGHAEPLYQQVKLGQIVGGMAVAEGTSMGFDFINGNWELTESDVRLTGPVEFVGELTKTPEGELQMLAPGTLTFTVIDSESGFIPCKYRFDAAPRFTLDGYNPEADFPELFSESDTIYVKATFDWLRLFKTERATGMDYAALTGIELLDKSE